MSKSKKKVSQGIDAFFPQSLTVNIKNENKKKEICRTTFRLESDLIENLKALAYWERETTTTLITKALQQFLDNQDTTKLQEALYHYKNK